MRCLIVILLCSNVGLLKGQFSDDFSDSNFSTNPSWVGDSSNFQVISESLKLQAPAVNDTSYLSTKSKASINAEWSFEVTLNFNPSSSNFCRIYLLSSNSNLKSEVQAYFVKIGGSSDEISLYRQDGLNTVEIIDGADKKTNLSNGTYKIRVTRDSLFKWVLYSDTSTAQQVQTEGSISDSAHKSGSFFGLLCKYTSTRSSKFHIDNIVVSGKRYIDNQRPSIIDHSIINNRTWQISFNESIRSDLLEASMFQTNGNHQLENIVFDSANYSLMLTFKEAFAHGKILSLRIDSIVDLSGNTLKIESLTNIYNNVDSIDYKSIVINEIMSDPEPALELPEVEYLELYNRSQDHIYTTNLLLIDSKDTLSISNRILKPKEYLLIINRKDSTKWDHNVLSIACVNSLSLSNSGERLLLRTTNKTIDSLTYDPSWYESDKKDGGWSLELINPHFICTGSENWTASIDSSGGSPGKMNSTLDTLDVTLPFQITTILETTSNSVTLSLNQRIFANELNSSSFNLYPYVEINDVNMTNLDIQLFTTDTFIKNRVYSIEILPLPNCFNEMTKHSSTDFVIPSKISQGNVLINEVLFNPYSGEKDFIELYNHSNNYVNLNDLILSTIENNSIADSHFVTTKRHILNPNEYVVLTEDSLSVLRTYNCSSSHFILETSIPSFPNKSGHIRLNSTQGISIDELNYNEDMHFSALDNYTGVSLERINPYAPSQNSTNWTSAASTCGFASPGLKNTQYLSSQTTDFTINPNIFSPDNDGYKDVCEISLENSVPGNIASISIYNENGYLIRSLVESKSISNKEIFHWDGTDRFSNKVPIGYYIITATILNERVGRTHYKSTVVIASKK